MYAILTTLPHLEDRDRLLAMDGGDRFDAELTDDGRVLVSLPHTQSADAARAVVHTLRDQLRFDGERMLIGEDREV